MQNPGQFSVQNNNEGHQAQSAMPSEGVLTREIRKHALAEGDLIGIWEYTFHEWDAAQAERYRSCSWPSARSPVSSGARKSAFCAEIPA
jgi:hypothetical protein